MSKMGEIHADMEMFAASKEHDVAMTVRAMTTSIDNICKKIEMAPIGGAYELVKAELDDIELSYARLAQLLHVLRTPVKEAAE